MITGEQLAFHCDVSVTHKFIIIQRLLRCECSVFHLANRATVAREVYFFVLCYRNKLNGNYGWISNCKLLLI